MSHLLELIDRVAALWLHLNFSVVLHVCSLKSLLRLEHIRLDGVAELLLSVGGLDTGESLLRHLLLLEHQLLIQYVLVEAQTTLVRTVTIVNNLSLRGRMAKISLPEAVCSGGVGLLLLELIEVGHHIADGLLVHGNSLLEDVESP